MMVEQILFYNSEAISITPSRSQLLIQWARSGLPASLPFETHHFPSSLPPPWSCLVPMLPWSLGLSLVFGRLSGFPFSLLVLSEQSLFMGRLK